MTPSVLGLDIGGTKLAVGMVSADGKIDELIVESTRTHEGPEQALVRLFQMGQRAIDASSCGAPLAVGISCGGPLDAGSGVLSNPLHLPGWIDIPVVGQTEAAYGLPAFLANDASAAALGEHRFGAGRSTSFLVYLTLSTGVGGGIVVDGHLYRGAAGNGGELGHLTVQPGGRPCTCGRSGCLEAYCSGTQIAMRAREAVEDAFLAGTPTVLSEARSLTAADVSRAAADGDEVASAVWAETTRILGQAVTDLVNILEPDVVVLGGGVTRSGLMLLNPVRRYVKAAALAPAAAAVRLELAGLGDAVGVVGAAAVAMDGLELSQAGAVG